MNRQIKSNFFEKTTAKPAKTAGRGIK